MKAKVTENGVLIPPEFLEGVKQVIITKTDGVIVVTPVALEDPIWGLGKNPVKAGSPDASENHDRYIYG